MKKLIALVLMGLIVYSCAKEEENLMIVKGNITGLRKGKFYLQKQIDSLVVSVDSVEVNGESNFILKDIVESPEMYYLAMDKSDKKIPFFGEKDTVYIKSSLEKFNFKYLIDGSENQDLLDDYYDFIQKFNGQNLDLQKAYWQAQMSQNTDSVTLIENQQKALEKRKYLYAINYAINHKDKEVSPYIALTDLVNANTVWLDSIYNSLNPEIKTSKYGEELKNFIIKIKVAEE
ncbi:DUF4369 domain-containing protein [Namhaeicola litoreus]|uniref:DUF4369 domain-containing protein n=1 Tax=Namhaeicola litoreus TaxID=1052145 RepID=A0ABW3Y1Z2_9FLAO